MELIHNWEEVKNELIGEIGTPMRDEHDRQFIEELTKIQRHKAELLLHLFVIGEIRTANEYDEVICFLDGKCNSIESSLPDIHKRNKLLIDYLESLKFNYEVNCQLNKRK